MLETMPASRVAAQLTREGVPSPNAGRLRKDHGVRHTVSGVWHQNAVVNIARNPLLLAVTQYGLRSMGDKLRFAPHGPRTLEDSDFRSDESPKVIRNPKRDRITAPARFEPLVDVERHQRLLTILDDRGKCQSGKPRARNPAQNPLGARVFDMNCSWPMYRTPYLKSFRYTCGCYQQTHGAKCDFNHVDGPTATRFMLSCLRQRMLSPTLLSRMERRFRELAAKDQDDNDGEKATATVQAELARVQQELKAVSANMARARTEAQYDAISTAFEALKARETALIAKVAEQQTMVRVRGDTGAEVAKALEVVHRLSDLMSGSGCTEIAGEAFRLANARLFLRFRQIRTKNRPLNQLASGVAVFGAAPDPIEIYRGPTGRRALNCNGSTANVAAEPGKLCLPSPPESTTYSGSEGKSLGNVSRGDRT